MQLIRRLALTVFAVAPLLASCASHVRLREPDARLPATFESPQPSDRGPGAPQAALDHWWTLYGDAQLEELVDQALANSPDAKDALAKLAQAAAFKREIYAQLLPQAQLTGSAAEQRTDILSGAGAFVTPGAQTALQLGFNVSWEADLFGRAAVGRKIAKADFQNAVFTYEASRIALAANVAESLFQARGFAIQLQDAQETERIDADLLRIAKARLDHGLAASSDVDQARAALGSAQAGAESLRAQLTAARRSLLLLIGRGVDPLATLPIPASVGTPPDVPVAVPGELMVRRPDVRAAQWRLQSAAGTLKLDKLALFPTITLQPGVDLSKTIGSFGYASSFWTLGAGLTVPVLDRPKLMAQIHVQHAVAEQAVIAYERAVQSAYADSENALVYLDSDKRRVEMLKSAEQSARAAYEKSRLGYARGLIDLQSTLIAENTWRGLHQQLTVAQATLMQRSVQLFKALGGGWTPAQPAATAPPEVLAGKG